jgi:hypothetical protein
MLYRLIQPQVCRPAMPEDSNKRSSGYIGSHENTVEVECADCVGLMDNLGKLAVAGEALDTQQ